VFSILPHKYGAGEITSKPSCKRTSICSLNERYTTGLLYSLDSEIQDHPPVDMQTGAGIRLPKALPGPWLLESMPSKMWRSWPDSVANLAPGGSLILAASSDITIYS